MRYELANRFSVAFLLVTVFLWGLAAYALVHRDREEARLLAAVLIAMSLWSLGDAIRIGAPTTASVLLWDRVSDTGIIFLAPTIFLFVASYTGRRRWLQPKYVAVLFGISGGFFVVAATNPYHGLWAFIEGIDTGPPPPVFEEGRGLLWYGFAIYGPALAVSAYYLLFRKMAEEERGTIYRTQALLVSIGILTPIVLTTFYLVDIVPYDPTAFGFVVSGVTFALAIFQYDLFDVAPIARDTAVSTTENGVLVIDTDERIVDANDSLSEMLDVPREELLGAPLSSIRSTYPQLADLLAGARDADETVTIRRDGEDRHYDIDVSPIRTEGSGDAGRVAIFNDVTETVRQRNTLLDRTAELQRQNERLDQFASVVSHDLRNPLQVADGALDIAEETGDPEDFETVRRAHERMDRMIEDLLTMARAGRTIDETEPVEVAALARESWRTVETADATLEIALPRRWTVRADPDRLRHLFENLFRNAVEHGSTSPPSRARGHERSLTVRIGPLRADGRVTGFFVEDDGIGIPPDERDAVLKYGHTTDDGGSGFGLAIVTEVVEAHGWEIGVTASGDGGARFEITTATGQPGSRPNQDAPTGSNPTE